MNRRWWTLLAVVLIIVLIIAIAGAIAVSCGDSTKASTRSGAPASGGVYVSLGDSVAAGNGASDPAKTSFAAVLAHDEGGWTLLQLAKAGATTQDVIDAQLPAALAAMKTKDVALVTVVAGGNDLAALVPNAACVQKPLPASCPLDATLASVERNLDAILARLRAADGAVPIVLLAYPNFFSGTGHAFEAPAGRVLPRLDDVIRQVAGRYPRTAVADAAPPFEGKGATLTHVLDAKFDPHPTDAGHRIIAMVFEDVLRKLAPGVQQR